VLVCFGALVNSVQAYSPNFNEPAQPYDVFVMDSDIVTERQYLGELKGEPHMYEFALGADTELFVQLQQLKAKEPIPFSLLLVKENSQNAGVKEIARISGKATEWQSSRDSVLGLSFSQTELRETLGPGIYRLEVSTPENFGAYMLTVGEVKMGAGYFKTISDVKAIRGHFDKSIFSMWLSSYIYYPIGIVALLLLLYFTWRRQGLIKTYA
jgi:hypothetical protein